MFTHALQILGLFLTYIPGGFWFLVYYVAVALLTFAYCLKREGEAQRRTAVGHSYELFEAACLATGILWVIFLPVEMAIYLCRARS